MQYRPFCCYDCGVPIIERSGRSTLENQREVRFELNGGGVMDVPFCATCADASWTTERLNDFAQAIRAVDPSFLYRIVRVSAVMPRTPSIVGVYS